MILDITPRTLLPWRTIDESIFLYGLCCSWVFINISFNYDGFSMKRVPMTEEEEYRNAGISKEECRETPEESYHKKLGEMISKVKAETKWRDIFKIVEESQRRLNEEK